jgi:hypothetical protein
MKRHLLLMPVILATTAALADPQAPTPSNRTPRSSSRRVRDQQRTRTRRRRRCSAAFVMEVTHGRSLAPSSRRVLADQRMRKRRQQRC